MEIDPALVQQVKALPFRPGVYLFRDAADSVIYIGKAASLRKRVASHFALASADDYKEGRLQERTRRIEVIVTDSEQHALILECTLVKKYRPRFNVLLKDGKAFPYIRIDMKSEWPRMEITRHWNKDGASYFGPFASASSVRQTMQLIRRLFPVCSCKREITGCDSRPCLEYHIHRCLGPCIGKVSREEYAEIIREVVLFLGGRQEEVVRELRRNMVQASKSWQYERAGWLRDQIQAVESVIEGQRLAMKVHGDEDVIAMASLGDEADVQVFFVRNSRLVGREHFMLQGVEGETPGRVLAGFLKQYYSAAPTIPRRIITQHPVEDRPVIKAWLEAERGCAVSLETPRRGPGRKLIEMVAENASHSLDTAITSQLTSAGALAAALTELKENLGLPRLPRRIECYDISNIQGTLAVGSMVVFEEGVKKPAHYRRFRIKTVEGSNDFAMMAEVLRRRFAHAGDSLGNWAMPDLVVVDGGKGQLSTAGAVLEEASLSIPLAALAKEREEIFLPDKDSPLTLPASSAARRLMQRIRDEAHRFALGYHTRLRHHAGLASALDSVPGIGAKKKKALLRTFGSVRGLRAASPSDLAGVDGMNPRLADELKRALG
jgi:excinuclease ABC subunit C